MEEEVQDRVHVEVGREEQGEGETHGKEQARNQTINQPLIIDDHEFGVTRTDTFLSHVVCFTSLCMRTVQEKDDVRGVSVYTTRRLQWIAINFKRNQL